MDFGELSWGRVPDFGNFPASVAARIRGEPVTDLTRFPGQSESGWPRIRTGEGLSGEAGQGLNCAKDEQRPARFEEQFDNSSHLGTDDKGRRNQDRGPEQSIHLPLEFHFTISPDPGTADLSKALALTPFRPAGNVRVSWPKIYP